MSIDFEKCLCSEEKSPAFVCFSCWRKGVRFKDRLGEPTGETVCPVPPVVEVKAIDAKLLRYKAAGILDCTCVQDKANKHKCPTHGEFYGSRPAR